MEPPVCYEGRLDLSSQATLIFFCEQRLLSDHSNHSIGDSYTLMFIESDIIGPE